MASTTPPPPSLALRLLRVARGWTERQLAQAAGTAPEVVCAYEKGQGADRKIPGPGGRRGPQSPLEVRGRRQPNPHRQASGLAALLRRGVGGQEIRRRRGNGQGG
jgi:hypothetical protein